MARTRSRVPLIAVFLVMACQDSGTQPSDESPPPTVASVEVQPGQIDLVVGQSATLTATALDVSGRVVTGAAITWATSDPGVATVQNGLVTAVGEGSATVEARSGTAVGSASVQVVRAGQLACVGLTLVSPMAAPLDFVEVTGIPAELDGDLAVEVTADGSEPGSTALQRVSESTGTLLAPIHPSGSPAGGPVELRLTDGEQSCPPLAFTVSALPAAPGTVEAVADSLQEVIRILVNRSGHTVAGLQGAALEDLPSQLVPLAVAQAGLDEPLNPESLRSILARGTLSDGEAIDLTLADALFAHLDLAGQLSEQLAILRASPEGGPLPTAAATGFDCEEIGEPDAEELDWCMGEALAARNRLDGASGELASDLSYALTVGALIPTPVTRILALAGSVYLWVWTTTNRWTAGVYPSELTSLEPRVMPTRLFEDDPSRGEWSAAVYARSTGYDVTDDAVGALLTLAGALSFGAKVYGKTLRATGAMDFVETALALADQFVLNHAGPDTPKTVPPRDFGPVSINHEDWSDAEIFGTSMELVSHREFVAVVAGSSTLLIQTEPGRFAGQSRAVQQDLEVPPILLSIEPSNVELRPGEDTLFTVSVQNSIAPDWVDAEAQKGTAEITYHDDAEHLITYKAPSDPESFPDGLMARYVGKFGAQARPDAPVRFANATIVLKEVVDHIQIEPASACVEPGQNLDLAARVFDPEDRLVRVQAVTWSASAGTIDEVGVFTAPEEPGSVTITAVSVADPEVSMTATLTVGGCTCRWSASVGGLSLTGTTDDRAEFLRLGDALSVGMRKGDTFLVLQGMLAPVGATGTFAGELIASDDLPWFAGAGTVTLTDNTDALVAGSATGEGALIPSNEPRSFSATFHIEPESQVGMARICVVR